MSTVEVYQHPGVAVSNICVVGLCFVFVFPFYLFCYSLPAPATRRTAYTVRCVRTTDHVHKEMGDGVVLILGLLLVHRLQFLYSLITNMIVDRASNN